MPYDILNNIPIPPRERKRKYNLDELNVGEVLVIPGKEKYTASAIYSAARSLGIRVSIRKFWNDVSKTEDTGIWRIDDKAEDDNED